MRNNVAWHSKAMRVSDSIVGAGFAVAGALVFVATLHYPTLEAHHPGPSLFPRLLATLMVVFGGLLSWQGLRSRDVSAQIQWRNLHKNVGLINALFVMAGVLAYILFVEQLGFLITGALILFVVMWRLQVRPLTAFMVALIFNTLVHFLFAKILKVPLPLGLLWW